MISATVMYLRALGGAWHTVGVLSWLSGRIPAALTPRSRSLWSLPVGTVAKPLGLRPHPTVSFFFYFQTTDLSKTTIHGNQDPSALGKVPRAFPTMALADRVTWSRLSVQVDVPGASAPLLLGN